MAENYSPLPDEWLEEMEQLADAEYGRLIRWYQRMKIHGTAEKLNGNERFYTKRCENALKRFKEAAQKRSEDARAAADKRWGNGSDAAACEGMRGHATVCDPMRNDATITNTITNTNTKTNTNISSPNGERNKRRAARFTPPSVEEVAAYCKERENAVEASAFVDFYASKGWRVGSQPMKDWKAAVRTWERRDGRGGRGGKAVQTPEDRQKQAEADAIAIEQVKRLREKMRMQAAKEA